MKICAILTCYLPNRTYGGPIQSRSQGFHELIRRGHNVTVLTSNIIDIQQRQSSSVWSEEIGGIRVIRFPSLLLAKHFSGIFPYSMFRWISKHRDRFDVFHISYAREIIPVLSAWTLFNSSAHVILQTHGTLDRADGIRRIIDRWISSRQLARAKYVIVLQRQEEATIRKKNPHIKTRIIPNGIVLDHSLPTWKGPFESQQVVLFLARLHPRKKVLEFIRTAKLLHEKNPDLKFRVVGPDGGEKESAIQLTRQLGLEKAVRFVGSVPREIALVELSDAAVYVLPSFNEPFATTVTEALAIGTPVVVTDTVQNLELLEEYDAAEISDPSPSGLAQSINTLIYNATLSRSRSLNGKRLVREELDVRITVDQLEKLYREVTGAED